MSNRNEEGKASDNLKTRLLRQLEETGYPVELKVGNILSSHGWNVEHNRYYIDEDEQKGREIDIWAHTNAYSTEHKVAVWLGLICEVKQSRRHPWVVLSTRRIPIETAGWGRMHYTEGKVDSTLLSFEQIESKSTTSQFTRIGRSYYEGFKSADAKSVIFEALTTVVKASEHWLKINREASNNETSYNLGFRDITFVDPLIILDGLLYEAYLDDDNCLGLNEIRHIPVSFGYLSKAYGGSNYLVEIVTISELPSLLSKKRKWIEDMKGSIISKLTKPAQ